MSWTALRCLSCKPYCNIMAYLKITDDVLSLDLPLAQRMVLALVLQLSMKTGRCTASNTYIEERLGLGKKTASRHLQALIDGGKVSFLFDESGRRSIVPGGIPAADPPQIADPPHNADPPQIAEGGVRKMQRGGPQNAEPILDNSRDNSKETVIAVGNQTIEAEPGTPADAGAGCEKKKEEDEGQKKDDELRPKKKARKVPSDFDRSSAKAFRELFRSWGAAVTGNQDAQHMRKLREALSRAGPEPEAQVRQIYQYLKQRGPAQHGNFQTEILSCSTLYQKITKLQAEIRRDESARHPTRPTAKGGGPDYQARFKALLGQRKQSGLQDEPDSSPMR